MSPEKLLDILTDRCREILGSGFTGLYVHGSYAMGGFSPLKSDIDYIIVCDHEPDGAVKRQLMDTTIAFERLSPAKGLEMHLMTRGDCLQYSDPPRFVLHYSGAHTQAYLNDPHGYVSRMRGQDIDLWAHLTVLRARGAAWAGPAICDTFAPVPDGMYIKSVLSDLAWDEGDCMYHVLNHCRTLAYIADGQVRSKAEGAKWALTHCDAEYRSVIEEALRCYSGAETMSASPGAEAFCRYASARIRAHLD